MSVSGRLTLLIVLLVIYRDQLATGNGVCKTKLNHDVYVLSNNLSCQEDILDNRSFVIERYRPAKKSCASNFDTTDILQYDIFEFCAKLPQNLDERYFFLS